MTYTFFKKLMKVTPAFLILPFMVGEVIAKVTDEPDQNCYYHVSDIEGPSDNIMQELTDSCVYQSDRSTNNFNKTAQCVEDIHTRFTASFPLLPVDCYPSSSK